MKKSSSVIISFKNENNEECILVVGGCYFKPPPNRQPGAEYTSTRTNETHLFNIATGEYIIASCYQTSGFKERINDLDYLT